MVLCVLVRNAILSFVPTPSAEATSTGCFKPGNAPSNIPPKLPISESVSAWTDGRAGAVSRGDEHGLFQTGNRAIEHPAETSDLGERARVEGRARTLSEIGSFG